MALSEGGRKGGFSTRRQGPGTVAVFLGNRTGFSLGLGGNGEGVDGTDSDPEVVMIIGVLMTLNGKQCHIHSARAASFSPANNVCTNLPN